MDIKDFVKQTIIGISEAVIEINEEKRGTGLVACPPVIRGVNKTDKYGTIIQDIEFNLCVEISSNAKFDSGIKIAIAKLELKTKRITPQEALSSSRFRSLARQPIIKNIRKLCNR